MDIPMDKRLHFAGGAFIAMIVGAIVFLHQPLSVACFAGLAASCAAGVIKEVWDSTGRGHVEMADFIATALGGLAGSAMVYATL